MPSLMRRALNKIGLATAAEVRELTDLHLRDRSRRSHASGVEQNASTFGSQFGYEENTKLRGSTKWDTLDQMENDPHVKGSLMTHVDLLRGAEWDFQAASDDPQDMLIRDFCAANLLRQSNDNFGREFWCQTSWQQRLFEILQFLRDGFSMFGITMRRQGARVVYDTIKWLEPSSVDPYGWQMDESDNLIAVKRTYQNSIGRYRAFEPIPVDQIALYVWELKGARFEGRPFIRSMYGAWFRKDFVKRVGAIYAQKIGAPSPVGHYPKGLDATQREAVADFVRQLTKLQAENFGVFPKNGDEKVDFEFVGAQHDAEHGLTKITDAENSEIAHGGRTKSDLLGETASGSRALGQSQGDREMLGIAAVASWIIETELHGSGNVKGLVERLVDANFPNVERYPELVCSKLDRHEGTQLLQHLPGLVKAGIIPNTPELRKQTTERMGYNMPDEAYETEPIIVQEPPQAPSRDEESEATRPAPDADEADEEPVAASLALESVDSLRQRIAPLLVPVEGAPIGAGFRAPTRLEVEFCSLAEISESFRIGERDTMTALREIRSGMVTDLFRRLASGKITERNLESQRRSRYRGRTKAQASLERVYGTVARVGADQVDEEIARQEGANDAAA